jgi:phage terminase large subunit-like protein
MVEASPALATRCDVGKAAKRITFPATRSIYRALSADVPTKEGLNIHGLVFDELHAQKTRNLWDTLYYGGIARRQPLMVAITTAGFDKTTICWDQHRYAEGVLSGGEDDDEFFAYIAAAGPEDDWKDPAVWEKANPSFGVTMGADTFEADCRAAQQSPLAENTFRRYRLNQWTEQEVRWLQMDKWDACHATVALDDLVGCECYGGLDLSATTDLSAFVLYFPDSKFLLPFFWLPQDALGWRAKQSKRRVEPWIPAHITLTPGNVIDYDVIREFIVGLSTKYDLRDVAVDPYMSTQIQTQLMGEGLNIVRFSQRGLDFTAPLQELERLTLSGELAHNANPVLRWMASNVVVKMDPAGNIRPDKSKAADRIDGVVAAAMAIGRALKAQGEIEPTITPV